jgi:lia operon protein LiaG
VKRIMILFLVLIGIYFIFTKVDYSSWLPFTAHTSEASVRSGTDQIDIDINGLSAEIIPENRDNLKADLNGKGSVIVTEQGSRILVTYKRNWLSGFPFFEHTKLTVYVPEDYKKNMAIHVGSGNLEFSGTSQTPMTLKNISVDMGSGSLKLNYLNTRSGSFDIRSGKLSVQHYSGKLNGILSSGIFDAQLDEVKDSIDVTVSSGMAVLDLPKDASFSLDGRVSSGMITNEFELKNRQEDRNHLQGIHGSGKYNINLAVSSGTIHIK